MEKISILTVWERTVKTIHLVNLLFIVVVPNRTFSQSEESTSTYVTIAFPQSLENNIFDLLQ